MKSKYKEIKKKTIDWLWSAISINDDQIIHIEDDYAIATDGIRLHVVNIDNLPKSFDNINISDALSLLENKKELSEFCINPKYLIDALSGFVPSDNGMVTISICGNDNLYGVKIEDDSGKVAFIACIHK